LPISQLDERAAERDNLKKELAAAIGQQTAAAEVLKCREAALRESDERYALTMRAINDGFYEWDVATSARRRSLRKL